MTEFCSLLIMSKCCDQCLTTPQRIVSGERAAEIISECKRTGNHFFCHKGTIAGKHIHCRGVHDALKGSRAYRAAKIFGIRIKEVDPDGEV
jgi:hypothetical protein